MDYTIALAEPIVIPQKTIGELGSINLQGRLSLSEGKLTLAEINGTVMVGDARETINLGQQSLVDVDLSQLQAVIEGKVKGAIVAKYKK